MTSVDKKIQGDLFSPKALLWLFAIGIGSFVFAVALMLFADENNQSARAAAHPYSDSAIGHRAFIEYLKALDIPTVISRDPLLAGQEEGLTVVLEPPPQQLGAGNILQLFTEGRPIFLVLPKWTGQADDNKPAFLKEVRLKPAVQVTPFLRLLDEKARISRPTGISPWTKNELGVAPSLAQPQLIRSTELEALISNEDGIFFGETEISGRKVYILSDPDILNNHGLDEGRNHVLVSRMIDYMRDDGGVFVDATVHGFVQSRNLWTRIFQFPYVIVTLSAFMTLIFFIWAASPRFGGPKRQPLRLQPGKAGLIENTATLLEYSSSRALVLRDFLNLATTQACTRLHIPPHLSQTELNQRLDKIGKARGTDEAYSKLRAAVQTQISRLGAEGIAAENLARRIHNWRYQIMRNTGGKRLMNE